DIKAGAENWWGANPGKKDELSAALHELGYSDVADYLGLEAPAAPKVGVSFADHAKADAENEAAAAKIDELVSGTGGHYPVKAAKAITAKLQADPAFLSEW